MFDFLSIHCYNLLALNLGGWLNGRAAVSKTAGCVFESRPPCQKTKQKCLVFCLAEKRFSHATCPRRQDMPCVHGCV